ncbi:MAG: diacylglycerol kinase family protein [Actinomycetota bacterium]
MTSIAVLAHSAKTFDGGLPALRQTLSSYGFDDPRWVEVMKAKKIPKEARRLRDEGVDLLFVWGGDGSVQRALDAVAGSGVQVAILPAGTANLFATNMGIPKDLEEAVRVGLHGARRTIDLGKTNGEHFGVMSGAGLDAFMIRDAEAGGLKDRIGSLAYVFSGSKNLSRDPVRMRIEVDGKRWFDDRASCVLVGNVGDVIGGISAFPDAQPDDGVLDIGVITAETGLDWLRTLSRSVVSDPAKSPFIQAATGKSFDIRMKEPLPYEIDGSERGMTRRIKTKVKPQAITVCVPETETT